MALDPAGKCIGRGIRKLAGEILEVRGLGEASAQRRADDFANSSIDDNRRSLPEPRSDRAHPADRAGALKVERGGREYAQCGKPFCATADGRKNAMPQLRVWRIIPLMTDDMVLQARLLRARRGSS